jgi:hypothetical protein
MVGTQKLFFPIHAKLKRLYSGNKVATLNFPTLFFYHNPIPSLELPRDNPFLSRVSYSQPGAGGSCL